MKIFKKLADGENLVGYLIFAGFAIAIITVAYCAHIASEEASKAFEKAETPQEIAKLATGIAAIAAVFFYFELCNVRRALQSIADELKKQNAKK